MIYLDNASTSFPKPQSVQDAVASAVRDVGANPGRGAYSSARTADRLVYDARKLTAQFFGASDPSRVIFTPGCTYSLNFALQSLLKRGERAVVGGRQHNAVTRTLESVGCAVSHFRWDGDAPFDAGELRRLVTPETKAVVINHASNVDGLLFPLDEIREACAGKPLVIDCAQTAGMKELLLGDNEVFCVPAHKGLWGVAGTGILAFGKNIAISPLVSGGTGSFSEDTQMPQKYPDRLEPGSANLIGISALDAGIKEVMRIGLKNIHEKKAALAESASKGLSKIKGVKIFRPASVKNRVPLFSFLIEGKDPAELADALDQGYGIACRAGMHCAVEAHRELGAFPNGAVRFAPGYFTTEAEVAEFVASVAQIARK